MRKAEEYERRLIARFGWRPSRALPCPRLCAGRHCLLGRNPLCLCRALHEYTYNFLDHARIWLAAPRQYAITTEPYGVPRPDVLADCRGLLSLYDLVLDVTNESYWFDGTTLLVIRSERVNLPAPPVTVQ